jgi:hypothetical protein
VEEVLHLPIDGGVHLDEAIHGHVQLELEQGAGHQRLLLVFNLGVREKRSKKCRRISTAPM